MIRRARCRAGLRVLPILIGLTSAMGYGHDLQAMQAPEESDLAGWSLRVAGTYLEIDGKRPPSFGWELTVVGESPVLWQLIPMGGLMLSDQGQSYLYGGINLPWQAMDRLTLRPSVAAGHYERGAGHELGSRLEFRSSLSVEFRLTPMVSASTFLYHLSNAGLGFRNPGLEAVGFGISHRFH